MTPEVTFKAIDSDAKPTHCFAFGCEFIRVDLFNEVRTQALEEAARMAEEMGDRYGWQMSDTPHKRIAAAIRALKDRHNNR